MNKNFALALGELGTSFRPVGRYTLSKHETTTDWKLYQTTIFLSGRASAISIRFDFYGKGKFWIDDVEILIDGRDISKARERIRRTFPAERDTEFKNGSDINFPPLCEQLTDNLELLGKLWGFLKYHHPQVGAGKYNWDYELFRILPTYLKAENIEQRDNILLEWIAKYGRIRRCRKCGENSNYAYINPDLSWIDNSNMSDELKIHILHIYSNRHQGNQFYIEQYSQGSPFFKNEEQYSNMAFFPDAGFRLLSLFRYWNMIQYFFPYKYITDKSWDDVLIEYIPKFISAQNDLEYELAALQLISEVNDSHANLTSTILFWSRGTHHAPFRIQFVEQKWIVTDYYNPELKEVYGPEIGDIITQINSRDIETIVDSLKKYYPASNEAARISNISFDLLRSNKSFMNIQYFSEGVSKQEKLTLYPMDSLNMYRLSKVNRNEKSYKFLNENIGYITLASIKYEDIQAIKETFMNTKGIIVDIRNYPAVDVVPGFDSWFNSQTTIWAKHTKGNVNNPGEFSFFPRFWTIPKAVDDETYQGKLVVIVNEMTQSLAEHTAMAFRAGDNTTIIGSRTAGALGSMVTMALPGGLLTGFTGGWRLLSGRYTNTARGNNTRYLDRANNNRYKRRKR